MNGTGSMPPYDGTVGGPMKTFFLLAMLFLLFLFFASSSLANVNLTNNGSTSESSLQGSSVVATPQIIAIQDNTANNTTANGSVPVTGGCSNPYIVQSGDSLSQIAANCNVTLAAIRLSNPDINNANLIYAGQQLNMPLAGIQPTSTAQTVTLPVTGGSSGVQNGSNGSQVILPQSIPQTIYNGAPVLRTGISLQVKAIRFPPNTPVNIAIGPKTIGYNVVAAGLTDATGTVISNITVPAAPDATIPWVVVVATTGQPAIQAMSPVFYIAPAQ